MLKCCDKKGKDTEMTQVEQQLKRIANANEAQHEDYVIAKNRILKPKRLGGNQRRPDKCRRIRWLVKLVY